MAETTWPIAASAGRDEPDPDAPFYRGQHLSGECDYMPPGADACCDEPPAYEVWWKPVPALDLDTKPVSATCQTHVVAVDRRLVEVIRTHPVVTASRTDRQPPTSVAGAKGGYTPVAPETTNHPDSVTHSKETSP